MKKITLTILMVGFLLFSASNTVANAQALGNEGYSDTNTLPFDNPQFGAPSDTKTLNQQSTTDKATADKQAQDATNTTNNRLGGGTASGLLAMFKIVTSPIRGILTIALSILNLALTLAGLLFELVIKFTVLDMKSTVDAINIIPVIHKSIRDFANMFFIFFLLYESIKLIIGYSDTKKIRTMLIHLIVASLLMNFSLFITKAAIDVSNIAAVGFYQQLPTAKASDSLAQGRNSNVGLGGAIMQVLKVPSIYDTTDIGDDVKFIAGAMGGIVVMVVLVFFFLVAGMIFLRRFVGLLGLMIFSPLMVAGWILPQLDSYSKDWWKKLTEYCMLAPTFMMLTWVAFKIIQDPGFSKIMQSSNKVSSGSLFAAFTGPTLDSVLIIFNFCVVIGLLAMAIINAASTNKHGEAAVKLGQKLMGSLGARTAGRFGNYLDDKIGNTSWGNSEAGRMLRSGTTGLMASSKYYGAKSYSDIEKADKALDKDIKSKQRSISLKADFNAAVDSKDSGKISDALRKMSNKEVSDLGPKTVFKPEVFAALNDDHFEEILKNEKYTEEDKVTIRNQRNKALTDALTAKDKNAVAAALKRMSAKQVEKLDSTILRDQIFAVGISSGQFLDLVKSNVITQETKDILRDNRYKGITDALNEPVATRESAVARAFAELKPNTTETSKMPKDILTNQEAVKTFKKENLAAFIKENVSEDTRSTIKNIIDQMHQYAPGWVNPNPDLVRRINSMHDWLNNNAAGQDF